MSWIPMYINKKDAEALISWLNIQEDVAFIVTDGPKRWKAVKSVATVSDGKYCIWHIESGPLPLLGTFFKDSDVTDPWKGWKEKITGSDPTQPWLGPGHPGIIWLNLLTSSVRDTNKIGLSSFGWIGNRYKVVGSPAPEVTIKWWDTLRRWVKKQAIKIPRTGPLDGPEAEIWAFRGAYDEILNGKVRANNPDPL